MTSLYEIAGWATQSMKSARSFYEAQPFRKGCSSSWLAARQAPVWDIHPNRRITRKKPATYVNHYSLHILDRDWGHITIKISGHPPFPAQVILNGHEYMDRQARKAGILFTRERNCSAHVSDLAGFAKIAETLTDESAIGRIAAVCRRWIYSTCLNCALEGATAERFSLRILGVSVRIQSGLHLPSRIRDVSGAGKPGGSQPCADGHPDAEDNPRPEETAVCKEAETP
jgi:hypothetical protein